MSKINKEIELLAPAKNLECGIAAINCGADAVYIGTPKFGARKAAGNTLEDINKLIDYAHKYWARVYVTLNTILNDKEILEAQKLIYNLYELGADAVIIQDMGILELDIPPIPLFASTQANNTSWQKLKFLENIGFQRAILARELTLDQIKEVKSKTNIELEYFIHGSLCVCYSGQCYMSYAIGGRSANRGECAQPCRKSYSLIDSSNKIIVKDRYLLSLKDLNLSKHIYQLINAGITSFKIEGRLKEKDYITNIVSYYRQTIDSVIENTNYKRASSGKSIINFSPDPYKSFNRGFTEAYIEGRKGQVLSINSPKSTGELLGKVVKVDNKCFQLDKKIKLNNGDGICFFDAENNLQGTNINNVENSLIYPDDMNYIKQGSLIYRNYDHEFTKTLDKTKIDRKIKLNINLSNDYDRLKIQAVDEDNNTVSIESEIDFEKAKNPVQAAETLNKQLIKLGDTEFFCEEIEIQLNDIPFIPVSVLNEMRRKLVELIRKARKDNFAVKSYTIVKNNVSYPENELDYNGNVFNKYAESFYKRHGVDKIEPAAESGLDMKDKKIMTTKHCLKYSFNLCPKLHKNKTYKEPLYIKDNYGVQYKLNFNCKKCEMEIFY